MGDDRRRDLDRGLRHYALIFKVGFAAVGRAGAYGMYENHNDYTFIIHQILPFIYLYSRHETSAWKRMFLYLSLAICVVGILLSLSRGGILALLLEGLLIIIFAMTSPRRWLLSRCSPSSARARSGISGPSAPRIRPPTRRPTPSPRVTSCGTPPRT